MDRTRSSEAGLPVSAPLAAHEAVWRKQYAASARLQGEFGGEGRFLAYSRHKLRKARRKRGLSRNY